VNDLGEAKGLVRLNQRLTLQEGKWWKDIARRKTTSIAKKLK
jgi:hypothetical protein